MAKTLEVDICVIGAGAAGLAAASGAAQMGARTILIEHDQMGGDSLNNGCVPSKSLIATSKIAQRFRHASTYGIQHSKLNINPSDIQHHIADVINAIAPHNSAERFEGLGVKVIRGEAIFLSPKTLQAGGHKIHARRFIIATGSRPKIPPIPGLTEVSYLTNESVFFHKPFPKHLLIIGGGPIGVEMAQAHARLGAKVTILELFSLLNKDDPETVNILRQQLMKEGITIRERIRIKEVKKELGQITVVIEDQDKEERISGSDLLVSAGRIPETGTLNLHAAGVETTTKGIVVDEHLKTTNRKIYAIGDVTGDFQLTHMATYQAGIVLQNALFMLPVKANYRAVPWVTYTDPEVAHVGITESEIKNKKLKLKYRTLRWTFDDVDRAQTDRSLLNDQPIGMIKVFVSPWGTVLGANIIGPQAGELITPWTLAVKEKMNIRKMAGLIVPYPTLSEINKKVATSFYAQKLFNGRIKKIVQFIQKYIP